MARHSSEFNQLGDRGILFLLASLVTSYPDGHGRDCINNLLEDERLDKAGKASGAHWPQLLQNLKQLSADNAYWESTQAEYVSIFEHSKELNPLYETEFGRDRSVVKGSALADVSGFYRAFGLLQNDESLTHEMPDHIAVELEFYSYMIFKELAVRDLGDNHGIEIVEQGRKKFLNDHLGRFVSAIARRPGVAMSSYFSCVYSWCAELVANECLIMGVVPTQVEFYGEASGYDGISCGAPSGTERVQ